MHALIADDDRMTAVILKHTLERWGLTVTVAHDGAEAWNILQQTPEIGLAILDWMMPEVDGPELCRRIRQDPARAHIYVLLLTGRQGQADVVAGLSAGADDYLTKPFDPDELRARVHVGLRVLGLQERLAERVKELEAALTEVKQLHGLLPICSYCKSVRSDQNYWERVEDYMSHHGDVQFTHGICPTCYDRVVVEWGAGEAPKPAV
jgi:DNA-binding response OmpR family regulator